MCQRWNSFSTAHRDELDIQFNSISWAIMFFCVQNICHDWRSMSIQCELRFQWQISNRALFHDEYMHQNGKFIRSDYWLDCNQSDLHAKKFHSANRRTTYAPCYISITVSTTQQAFSSALSTWHLFAMNFQRGLRQCGERAKHVHVVRRHRWQRWWVLWFSRERSWREWSTTLCRKKENPKTQFNLVGSNKQPRVAHIWPM